MLFFSTGKVDLTEFKSIELERIREYIAALLNDSSLRRIPSSKISWLWHDEDELLRYQPELLHGFHERLVSGVFFCFSKTRWGQTTPQMGHEMSGFLVNF